MTLARSLVFAGAFLALSGLALQAADEKKPQEPAEVSYYRDIRPIFQQNCQGCHQPAKAQGGYVMTSHAALLKTGDKGEPGVAPGKPDDSMILFQITSQDGKPPAMPQGRDPLTEHQINLIKKWIAQGAKDDTPKSAQLVVVDEANPPKYELAPVITSLDYSPDGTLLAVAGYHEVLLHKADGSGLVARLIGASERVQSLAFSSDGKRLAVTGGNPGRFGEVQVWDLEKKKLKLSVPVTFDTLYGVSWSPDGSKIAFGCADNTVRAIDAEDGKQILYQGAHNDWVLGTVFSTEGTYLVSVSRDRSMKLTDVPTQRFIDNVTSITPGALKGGLLTVNRRPQLEKKMSKVPPDTPGAQPKVYDELLAAGSDGTPRLYKMHREAKRVIGDDFNKIRDYESMPGRIYATCFSADGGFFAAGSSLDGKGEVRVYKVDDGKRISTFEGQKGAVYALAFHPDGKTVASTGFDGVVRLNDPLTGKLLKEFVPVPLKSEGTSTDDAKKDAAKEELKKLQGTWKVVSAERQGKAKTEEETKSVKFIIQDDTMAFEKDGKSEGKKAPITIDPTKKPKTIDIFIADPNHLDGGRKILGIYMLEGDTLTIAGGKQRPTEFKTTSDTGDTEVIVLKREKP